MALVLEKQAWKLGWKVKGKLRWPLNTRVVALPRLGS